MKSREVVRAKLEARTEADCSESEVSNNKIHYYLKFESSRGWQWLYQQISDTSDELDIPLEPYKITTSGVSAFEVEVRELVRREGVVDENQQDLSSFES